MLNMQEKNQPNKHPSLETDSAANSNALLSNLLFQLNSDSSKKTDNKAQQQNSIWSFNSSS